MLSGEVEDALRQLNDLASHGKDLGRLLSDLLNHFRNLLIFQVSRGDLKMLEVSEAEAASLADQSKMAGTEGLTRIMEVFAEAEMRLRDAASKKILVEVALLKAVEARTALSLDAVLKQLKALRDGQPSNTAAAAPPETRPAASFQPTRSEASRKAAAPHAPLRETPTAAEAHRPRRGELRRLPSCRSFRFVGTPRRSRRPCQPLHAHLSSRSPSRLGPRQRFYHRL